jgi:hypothetical protein
MVVESGVEDGERANAREHWPRNAKPRGITSGLLLT